MLIQTEAKQFLDYDKWREAFVALVMAALQFQFREFLWNGSTSANLWST